MAGSELQWRKLWPYLVGLFLLALLPRLYSAQTVGWGWDAPRSFTLVNFDEAGSCRAALQGFDYSTFIGGQTIAIADLLGVGPAQGTSGDASTVKRYCHSPQHILIARTYSAVLGALTVVVLALLSLQLLPAEPKVAWTAALLLAFSGFHISESHSGTVDAASVFFIYAFLLWLVVSVRKRSGVALVLSPLLLVAAVWTKYWVFAVFSYVGWLPKSLWQFVSDGVKPRSLVVLILAVCVLFGLVTNSAFQQARLYPLLALFYLLVPWQSIRRPMIAFWLLLPLLAYGLTQVDLFAAYTTGSMAGRFGADYGAIGWNKWPRNLINVPVVLIIGLGLPACLFLPTGLRAVIAERESVRLWLCLLPLLVFALFMAFLAPVTYYRHYLALIPVAALLAALGFWRSAAWAGRPVFLSLFLLWPALLAVDIELDYHRDPRIDLRQWYDDKQPERIFHSFYVNPPAQGAAHQLFRPEYASGDAAVLRQAQYLILSENWYDTAFANELNGPLTGNLDRLIKTRPDYALFYREALSGSHPSLQIEEAIDVHNFMPELVLHKVFYGTFQTFVGDIKIMRIVSD
jgi:hypothetical protein